jgi:nucleotide-binding universal stress UspA family protein
MKKVLIALDYNPTAQKVAEIGYSLAKAMKAEVILLHVINEPNYYSAFEYGPIMGFTGYINADLLKTVEPEELKQDSLDFLSKTKNHLNDEKIKTTVLEGDTSTGIIRAATEMSADIIVLGSHSRKWLEQVLMGSVAEAVLRQSDIPLFIVPTKKYQD